MNKTDRKASRGVECSSQHIGRIECHLLPYMTYQVHDYWYQGTVLQVQSKPFFVSNPDLISRHDAAHVSVVIIEIEFVARFFAFVLFATAGYADMDIAIRFKN